MIDICKTCRYWGFREMLQKPYSYSGDIPCLRCKRFCELQDLYEGSEIAIHDDLQGRLQ